MRIVLGIQYQGTHFSGWQSQKNLSTVQGSLESALEKIAQSPIKTFCAGRTDTGVHALGQIVHFDTEIIRPDLAWVQGVNSHLSPYIAVQWMQKVDSDFHARFSAVARTYRYVIYNHKVRSAISFSTATWIYHQLNIDPMQEAANHLVGEQDFSSFRSSECESLSPYRNIHSIHILREGNYIFVDIKANAFLHHMVRNIVGTLLVIGRGLKSPDWIQEVLQAKDRRQAAQTAPPTGLYLMTVEYPKMYKIHAVPSELFFSQ